MAAVDWGDVYESMHFHCLEAANLHDCHRLADSYIIILLAFEIFYQRKIDTCVVGDSPENDICLTQINYIKKDILKNFLHYKSSITQNHKVQTT